MAQTNKVVVLVTCGSIKEARTIAHALVAKRLAACVSVIDAPVRSVYRWNGKVKAATEYLLLIKTKRGLLARTQKAVAKIHSYDVPEFITLPISGGSGAYLKWLDDCL